MEVGDSVNVEDIGEEVEFDDICVRRVFHDETKRMTPKTGMLWRKGLIPGKGKSPNLGRIRKLYGDNISVTKKVTKELTKGQREKTYIEISVVTVLQGWK